MEVRAFKPNWKSFFFVWSLTTYGNRNDNTDKVLIVLVVVLVVVGIRILAIMKLLASRIIIQRLNGREGGMAEAAVTKEEAYW